MATVCQPAVVWPDHRVAQDQMLQAVAGHHHGLPRSHLERGLAVMRNTQVDGRYLVQPLHATLAEVGFGQRNQLYQQQAVRLGTLAGQQALALAGLDPGAVDALVVVSCTGYMLPGPDAHIAQALGLRPTTRRLPIQQLGCAAGATALAQALEYLRAQPVNPTLGRPSSVLVVAVELCSLSWQPSKTTISDFISTGLFGDGAAAAVVTADDRSHPGVRLEACCQHLIGDTLAVIAGTTSQIGLHFATHPRVRAAVPVAVQAVREFLEGQGCKPGDLGFVVCHSGGPAVLHAVAEGLDLPEGLLGLSWQSLREVGNVSSVVVLDVLARLFTQARPRKGTMGLLVAFGPGFTTEMLLGIWHEP